MKEGARGCRQVDSLGVLSQCFQQFGPGLVAGADQDSGQDCAGNQLSAAGAWAADITEKVLRKVVC